MSTLDVATPERVALSLPIAGIGYRSLAYLIDAALLFAFWVVGYFAVSLAVSDVWGSFRSLAGMIQTLAVVGLFATQWVYWTASEALWHGQTIGKRLMRIRVVRDDGSPVSFLESAIRNLCRAADFLPFGYAAGITAMLLTQRNRRLGDLVAGTVLVREETIALTKYGLGAGSSLPASDVEMILGYLDRAPSLERAAREQIALAMAKRFGGSPTESSLEAAEQFLRSRVQGAS